MDILKQIRLRTLFYVSPLWASLAMGNEDLSHLFLPQSMSAGSSGVCVMSTQGKIKCWGGNSAGELGIGSTDAHGADPETMGRALPPTDLGTNVYARSLCSGDNFSCATSSTGAVRCWGQNVFGALGQGHERIAIGRKAGDMGDNLLVTDLGSDFAAADVQCGGSFACALSSTGKVKCWGRGVTGELGVNLGVATSVGRKKIEMGANLPVLPLPEPVQKIVTGSTHACGVANNKIYCWGNNNLGQVGAEINSDRVFLQKDPLQQSAPVKLEPPGTTIMIDGVTAGTDHTCALYRVQARANSEIAKIKCWGGNAGGQLGAGIESAFVGRDQGSMGANLQSVNLGLNDIVQIEAYSTYTCALSKQGKVKCWGDNSYGQLGLGDFSSRGQLEADMGSHLPEVKLGLPVKALIRGSANLSVCAILINHEIKCWGYGSEGALGYEDSKDRGGMPNDMGENLPFVQY